MPATAFATPLTTRQQNFIAALAAERNVPSVMQEAVARAAARTLPGRAASELIATLLDQPRRDAGSPARRPNTGEPIPTPDAANRAGRMLLAGGIEATVTLPNGEHVTLTVRSRKSQGRGWTNAAPTDEGARITLKANGIRIGWVNVEDGQWKLTTRTRSTDAANAAHALFLYAAGQPTDLRVQEASRCGRCMRTLTDPVSISRGIGPECFGRGTGSRAARIEAGIGTSPLAPTQAQIAAQDEANDRAFAAREVAQERAAFASDPDFRAHRAQVEQDLNAVADALTTPAPDLPLTTLAADAASPVLTRDKQRARDLIAEALDAYCSDADRDFAMRTFDQLAAR